MNYHIACYCQAYAYLTQLLPLWKDEEPEQAAKQGEETSNEKARQGKYYSRSRLTRSLKAAIACGWG